MKQKEFEKRWKKSIGQFAEEERRSCGEWESGGGLSQESRQKLWKRIAAEEAQTAPRRSGRISRRYVPVLAAALALVIGMGAVANRAWISASRNVERESEVSTKVNNEEKDSVLLQEEEMYKEVQDELGIVPLRFGYQPEGMELDKYTTGQDIGSVNVYYLYDGNLILIKMMKQTTETSSHLQWDGSARKLDVSAKFCELDAYCVDEEEHNYGANITYGNGYYSIFGKFDDENEFLRILEKIYFKKV